MPTRAARRKRAGDDDGKDTVYRIRLPVEVLGIVAQYLVAADLYGTCAALNITSKTIKYETLPTLYKTVVGFGAKWYKKTDKSCWGDGPEVLSPRQKQLKAQLMEEWTRLKASAGMEWVEFFAMPPFLFVEEGEHALSHTRKSPLKRIRAFISPLLRDDPSGGPPIPLIDVGLQPACEFGGDDLLSLTRAIMHMVEIGGDRVRGALHGEKGIQFMVPAGEDMDLPTLQMTITRLASVRLPVTVFRPRAMGMRTMGHDESSQYMALTLVEMLYWLRLEPDRNDYEMPQSSMEIDFAKLDTVTTCVKALRTLCKSNPAVVQVAYCFRFDPHEHVDLNSITPQINNIVAIIRAFYMLAGRHLHVKDYGVFLVRWVTHHGDFCWLIQPQPAHNPMWVETHMRVNGRNAVLFRDYPNAKA